MFGDPTVQPSWDVIEEAGAYDVLANYGRPAHGLRAKGAGTVTIKTQQNGGTNRTINVNDGELVPVQFTNLVSMAGPTSIRIHIPPT